MLVALRLKIINKVAKMSDIRNINKISSKKQFKQLIYIIVKKYNLPYKEINKIIKDLPLYYNIHQLKQLKNK